jgi:hypothetical protein
MKRSHLTFAAAFFAILVGSMTSTQPSRGDAKPTQEAKLTGLHDFDFLVGQWRVHHRQLKERLADSHEWTEFEGSLVTRRLMNGWANVGDNVFKMPGGEVRGVGLRSYDPKTGQWSVWWLDGRDPSANLGAPIKGGFQNGVGTFFSDEMYRGRPIRVRVTWSRITSTSAHWEQAFSPDGGESWETNWTSDFTRSD